MEACSIRMTREKVQLLYKMYGEVLKMGVLDKEDWVKACARELRDRLRIMKAKRQHEYRLKLCLSEAIAFRKCWQLASEQLALPVDYGEIIRVGVEQADKFIQGAKYYLEEEDDEEDD